MLYFEQRNSIIVCMTVQALKEILETLPGNLEVLVQQTMVGQYEVAAVSAFVEAESRSVTIHTRPNVRVFSACNS